MYIQYVFLRVTTKMNIKIYVVRKKWPVLKQEELERGLEYEHNGFAKRSIFCEGSFIIN